MVKKVSELPAATDVDQTDLTVVVQGGVTKKATSSLVRKLQILFGGSLQGTRPKLNFIQGTDTTVLVQDDAANDRVNVTISTTLGPNSPAHKLYMWDNFS